MAWGMQFPRAISPVTQLQALVWAKSDSESWPCLLSLQKILEGDGRFTSVFSFQKTALNLNRLGKESLFKYF